MLALFIVFSSLFVLSILFFVLYPKIRRSYLSKHVHETYWKSIYKLAIEQDYYLINDLVLKSSDSKNLKIDHLLFTNKFIFVFMDSYYQGAINYKINDNCWLHYFGNKNHPKKEYIDNLLVKSAKKANKLSQITMLDSSFLISVVLINDDCLIDEYESKNKNVYLIKLKSLKRLIKEAEKRDIKDLKQEQLAYVVKDIARKNLNKKKR